MIGVENQTDIENARFAFGRFLASQHVEKVCGDVESGIGGYRLEPATNAICSGHYCRELPGQSNSCLDAGLARNISRVGIVEFKSGNCRAQNVNRISFTGKLLHEID